MISFKDIKSQNNAVRYILKSISLGRVKNSYLFSGPEGVGRALAAKAFLAHLLCKQPLSSGACGECSSCKRDLIDNHPDVMWISPEKNRKIKIGQIRKAKEALNLKPFESNINACVIEEAHMMTVEASNALLKVLEELPGESLIILISSKRDLLLPTVLSRCSEIRFEGLPIDVTSEIVQKNADIDSKDAYLLSFFSEGSPGRALEMINEGLLERKETIQGLLKTVAGEENFSCLNWDSESKDVLFEDIELLIMFFRDVAISNLGADRLVLDKSLLGLEMFSFFKGYDIDKISGIVEKLIQLKQALAGNVNPKLVAQVLPAQLK